MCVASVAHRVRPLRADVGAVIRETWFLVSMDAHTCVGYSVRLYYSRLTQNTRWTSTCRYLCLGSTWAKKESRADVCLGYLSIGKKRVNAIPGRDRMKLRE